ncbi:hypothetical protein QA644_10665 [Rhizobium sp. CC1099]|uniref:hypothetical protein n=1 Tax=Rhizobium sp. CC1099 TaxID=3039160 RepID=UPI0024B2290E|nr:hypothetical protein [Rhizobium sp. CC1099]WFU89458.1 hypothetical protein QA644_10665 [Rhizobium sp. CC1099]
MKFFMDHKASPDWAVRRRIIILSLIWEAVLITFLVVFPRPNAIGEIAMINLASLFGGTVGSYIFGAVWDRKNELKADVAQQAVSQGDTDTTVEVKQ